MTRTDRGFDQDGLRIIARIFPDLQSEQLEQLGRLQELVREWNERVNLVSRKDTENLEERHVLHSLAVARVLRPAAGTRIADVGTGGGFPGLPLAVCFPDCRFTLIDSIAKKCRAVASIAATLGLDNVRVLTQRAEDARDTFDFVLGRAVASLPEFLKWTAPLVTPGNKSSLANGILYFKGSRYQKELAELYCRPARLWPLVEFFPQPFFEEKFLLHFPAPIRCRNL